MDGFLCRWRSWTSIDKRGPVGKQCYADDIRNPSHQLARIAVVRQSRPVRGQSRSVSASRSSLDSTAFRGGPYAGYNWQFGPQWVAGVEENWAWANQSKSVSGAFYPGGALGFIPETPNASFSVQTTWDASVRGRVGYLVTPDVLIYSTGGAAWMHVQANSTCPTGVGQACSPGAAVPAVITDSTTRLGWTIGGGIEAHLWGNWLVRGEYRYTDYGTWTNNDLRTFELAATTLAVADSVRLKTNTTMLGLAYHFGR